MPRNIAMRSVRFAVAGLLLWALPNSPGQTEPKAQAKKAAAGPQVRYFNLSSDMFADLGVEAYLKETRQGAKLVSAELDVCHPVAQGSARRDRFVVPLKIEDNRLTGNGQTQEGKKAVSVDITRRGTATSPDYEGSVSSGDLKSEVQSSESGPITPEDFADMISDDDEIEMAPTQFIGMSPQVLKARVTRDGLAGLLDKLRSQNVRIAYLSIEESCRVLRSGQHILRFTVDPDRAAAVLAAIKSAPGVAETGYSSSGHRVDRAIRFPSAGWRNTNGNLERIKFTDVVSRSMAKALGATVDKSSWDDRTGELSVVLKRPHEVAGSLKLQQVMTVTVLVAPEAPGNREHSLLWIENVSWQAVEDRFGARLEFQLPGDAPEGESADPDGIEGLAKALAAELKGQVWDTDSDRWQ
jgi:hypothetical protein